MEGYKFTSLEQRVKVPFKDTIKAPEVKEQAIQLPLPEPIEMTEGVDVMFPLSTAQPGPVINPFERSHNES